MNEIIYPLSNDTWDDDERKAIQKVIDSNHFTMGPCVAEYEKKFAEKFGVKYAVMSNSGSSANLLAIAALVLSGRLHKGDEVLITSVSWSTTYSPLAQYGLKIRFVDIDINTLNLDSEKLLSAITSSSKAIFAVNLLGNPNNFDKIIEICEKYNLILIEDNCEAMGAEYNGKKTGTIGLLGTFSSFYSHHISTMEGGVTVTNDKELYHYMLSIRAHGWTRDLPFESEIYSKMNDDFYESFNFLLPGYNLRPLELEAAIGLEQLKKLESFITIRRENALFFQQKIKNMIDFQIQSECGKSSWYGFAIVLIGKMKGKRDLVIQKFKEAGIEVRPIVAGNFTKQKALEYMEYSISGDLSNAEYIHENGFYIGNHSIPLNKNIMYLVNVLNNLDKCNEDGL